MDICLLQSNNEKVGIKPLSIHGVLWLQTHFDHENWDAIILNKAVIPSEDAKLLLEDATLAGINVNLIPACSKMKMNQ